MDENTDFAAPYLQFANVLDFIQPRVDVLPGNKTEAKQNIILLLSLISEFQNFSLKLLMSQVAGRPESFTP